MSDTSASEPLLAFLRKWLEKARQEQNEAHVELLLSALAAAEDMKAAVESMRMAEERAEAAAEKPKAVLAKNERELVSLEPILQACFEINNSPLFAWELIAVSPEERELPAWVRAHLGSVARDLMALATNPRIAPDEALAGATKTFRLSRTGRWNPFTNYRSIDRKFEAGRRLVLAGEGKAKVDAEIAALESETGMSRPSLFRSACRLGDDGRPPRTVAEQLGGAGAARRYHPAG